MGATARVSLKSAVKRPGPGAAPRPLLDSAGAHVILGGACGPEGLAAPVMPSASALFGPRGVCLASHGLWVADTGHHRLLGWRALPAEDGTPADVLIGQPDFAHEGRNAKGEPGPATLNVPTGVAAAGSGLAVADAWNHRVLLWHEAPRDHNRPADLVLGQAGFGCTEANRGREAPGADTLFWPYGVAWDGTRLWVADTGNRRVLAWEGMPRRNGQPADLVLGQRDFACRDENGGGPAGAASMRWPHAIAFLGQKICIADAGNNRVMIWHRLPARNGQACDAILGQRDEGGIDHNQGDYWPSAASLNMPYGIAAIGAWLVVADTANSRIMAWHAEDVSGYGAPARLLSGQLDWEAKGDNRWQMAARDSLCWPYGVSCGPGFAAIADSGNNRVLLWRWNAGLMG